MRRAALLVLFLHAACASGPPPPAALDTRNESCRHCRMMVSDVHFAAQIGAPGDEPLFFDDIGCLKDYLASARLPDDGVAWVADHRTGEWVRADLAVYTLAQGLQTPMGSGIVAHGDDASKAADAHVRGPARAAREVFGDSLAGGAR